MNKRIKTEKFTIKGIPIVSFEPKTETPKETIVHYHGWSFSVEESELLGEVFAMKGYRIVMPELPGHGVRGTLDYASFKDSFSIVEKTVEEYFSVREELLKKFNIEEKFVVSGHSLGSVMAASIINNDPKVRAQIFYNGMYDYENLLENLEESITNKVEKLDSRFKSEIQKIVKDLSFEKLQNYDSLFMVGLQDNVILPSLMQDFERKLRAMGVERPIFKYYISTAHDISYPMLVDTFKFLEKE